MTARKIWREARNSYRHWEMGYLTYDQLRHDLIILMTEKFAWKSEDAHRIYKWIMNEEGDPMTLSHKDWGSNLDLWFNHDWYITICTDDLNDFPYDVNISGLFEEIECEIGRKLTDAEKQKIEWEVRIFVDAYSCSDEEYYEAE